MLQQTEVSVVLPYFLRWIERFPTFESLAEASMDEVIKEWEGLGYYRRARNLKKAAEKVCRDFGGYLPSTEKELRQIDGIGEYTAAALAAFAFKQRTIALDGNVLRVASRLFGIHLDITTTQARRALKEKLMDHLPHERAWEIAEAWIELGALVCKKQPECTLCPLRERCYAYQHNLTEKLPVRKERVQTTRLFRAALLIRYDGEVLVCKGEEGKVMGELYEFPQLELTSSTFSVDQLVERAKKKWGLSLTPVTPLDEVRYGFTRYTVRLFPWVFQANESVEIPNGMWQKESKLVELPFSSGHRRALGAFLLHFK